MISVVVYGRNDNYGYNLHKRAALSINCIAEVLTDEDDEILFVDYNTPDDYPTFPEAIQDTFTANAKGKLRILRARSSIHSRYADKTHLFAVEPIARNIAVRRSNPSNRWILSTNSDMIFVPRDGRSLTEITAGLPPGHYGTARLEIPESLWESFDRLDPASCISFMRSWPARAHLNEVVYGNRHVLFDGPGDFQLIQREDLFAIHGFDERMVLGWHVDSNIARRLNLFRGNVASVLQYVYAYHCDHTRQVTPAHRRERVENSIAEFIENVTDPVAAIQAESWGCANDRIEEIRLNSNSRRFVSILEDAAAPGTIEHYESTLALETYPNYDYVPSHVLAFIVDLLVDLPRNLRLGWCGVRGDLFALVVRAWQSAGFELPIRLDSGSVRLAKLPADGTVLLLDTDEWIRDSDMFVFEFGLCSRDGGQVTKAEARVLAPEDANHLVRVRRLFDRTTMREQRRLCDNNVSPRRFVGVNCIHNAMENVFNERIGITYTPYSTRVRHGFVLPLVQNNAGWAVSDQLSRLVPGRAGKRDLRGLRANPEQNGCVFHGPYMPLNAGDYRITVDVDLGGSKAWRPLLFDCVLTIKPVRTRIILPLLRRKRRIRFRISVPETFTERVDLPLLATRCFSFGRTYLKVTSCFVEYVPRTRLKRLFDRFRNPLAPDALSVAIAFIRAVRNSSRKRPQYTA